MKKRKVRFDYNNKKIEIELKDCNFFQRFSGLMFTKKTNAKALLFDFKKPVKIAIHSYFVFFPFWAIWINSENKVVDVKKVSSPKPYIVPKEPFCKLIEIPATERYSDITKLLVGD